MGFSKKEDKLSQQTSSMIIDDAVPRGQNVPGPVNPVNPDARSTTAANTSSTSENLDNSGHAPTSLKYTPDASGVNAVKGVVGTAPSSATSYTTTQGHEISNPTSSN